jgi:Tfp pilus assembly pilus retraction ATPase PilT
MTRRAGSITREESLARLVKDGSITRADAMARAGHPDELDGLLPRA